MGSCRQPSDSDVVRPPSVGRLRALEPITRPDGGAGGLKPRLQATLAVPVLPQHVAPRTRLSELIERTSDRLLTLVSAPAGYGKTTAVATWANSRPVPDALLWASVTDVERGSDKPWPFISAVAQYAAAAR